MPALTSLRFLAALYVVLFHVVQWHPSARRGQTSLLTHAWHTFCAHGFAAVGFFFVLSGFILAYNYPPQRVGDVRSFYRARFARVYPIYVLGLLVAMPFLVARLLKQLDPNSALIECLLAFPLLQAWFPAYWSAVNIPGWSLSVEAFFYATYPWLTRLLARAVHGPRLIATLCALYALAMVAPAIGTWFTESGMPHDDLSTAANVVRYAPLLALPEFAFGIVLGHARRTLQLPERTLAHAAVCALPLLLFALCTDTVPYMLLHNGALLPLWAPIILACSFDARAPRWLRVRWLERLGEASYALYVLHLPVWIYLKIVLERSGMDPLRPWLFPLPVALAVTASVLAHDWIERPARAWLNARR